MSPDPTSRKARADEPSRRKGEPDPDAGEPSIVLTCTAPRCGARFKLRRGVLTGRRCRRCGSALVPETMGDERSSDGSAPTVEVPVLVDLELSTPIEPSPAVERFLGYDQVEPVWSDERGELLKGRDIRANRVVAIRVLSAAKTADSVLAASFIERAQHTARLEHPGIVVIHEIGLSTRGELYATRHWIDGERLGVRLERWRRRDNPPPLPRRLEMLLKVCDALAYAHARGVTHGALSADSVILGDYGEVIVLDWDRQGEFSGETAASRPRDLDAIGGLLRHLLTLMPPRDRGPRLAAALSSMPRDLEAVASRAADGDYADVEEITRDLDAFLDGQVLQSVLYSPAQQVAAWARRHTRAVAAMVAGVVAAAGLALSTAWHDYDARQEAIRQALALELALPDPSRLVGWSQLELPDEPLPDAALAPSPAREDVYLRYLEGCRAWEAVLALSPNEPAARSHRVALGERLGRVALVGGEWAQARRCFLDLGTFGASPADTTALVARVDRLRDGVAAARRQRLRAIVADVAADLGRAGRSVTAPTLDEHVASALRLADDTTPVLLAQALDRAGAGGSGTGRPDSDPEGTDLAVFCCRVLGRLPQPEAASVLASWSTRPVAHRLVVEAGLGLARSRHPAARRALDALRDRIGREHPSWLEVAAKAAPRLARGSG